MDQGAHSTSYGHSADSPGAASALFETTIGNDARASGVQAYMFTNLRMCQRVLFFMSPPRLWAKDPFDDGEWRIPEQFRRVIPDCVHFGVIMMLSFVLLPKGICSL